jgi:error-prone DNA polymerase
MPLSEQVVADYQTLRLSLKAHPISFLRGDLARRGFTPASNLRRCKVGAYINVAGIVLIRQRPGSAKGVCFITLEDESGVINLVIWPDLMEKLRKIIMSARLMEVRGRIEYDDEVTHVIVTNIVDASAKLMMLSEDHLVPAIARADEVNKPVPHSNRSPQMSDLPPIRHGHPRNAKIIPNSRDFH